MVVNRPNVLAFPIWALIGFIGVAIVVSGGASGAAIAVGGFMLACFGLGIAHLATTRVVVEGAELRQRRFGRWSQAVRLDRLRSATLSGWSRSQGPILRLADLDGRRLEIDATNHALRRLWEVLAVVVPEDVHVRPGGPSTDLRLRRKLERHRSPTPSWRLPVPLPPAPEPLRVVHVSRLRAAWWLLGGFVLAVGLLSLAAHDPDVAASGVFVVVGAAVLLTCCRLRVTIEDGVLCERGLVGPGARVDVRRLRSARVRRGALGRVLVVEDEHGATARLHALARDLRPVLRDAGLLGRLRSRA